MRATTEPLPLAAYVTRCTECDAEVQSLELGASGKAFLRPCGHKASMKLVRNPRLVQP
jgi:uncharacterized paraquat-inducible protein A